MQNSRELFSWLIVDDVGVETIAEKIYSDLEAEGLPVGPPSIAFDIQMAMAEIESHTFDLVVTDMNMPNRSGRRDEDAGLDLLAELKQQSPQTEAIVLTGYGTPDKRERARRLGAVSFIDKGDDGWSIVRNEVRTALERALSRAGRVDVHYFIPNEPKWVNRPEETWSLATQWSQFEGEYIALAAAGDDTIVAHAKDFDDLLNEARRYVENPSVTLIPKGGWASWL